MAFDMYSNNNTPFSQFLFSPVFYFYLPFVRRRLRNCHVDLQTGVGSFKPLKFITISQSFCSFFCHGLWMLVLPRISSVYNISNRFAQLIENIILFLSSPGRLIWYSNKCKFQIIIVNFYSKSKKIRFLRSFVVT